MTAQGRVRAVGGDDVAAVVGEFVGAVTVSIPRAVPLCPVWVVGTVTARGHRLEVHSGWALPGGGAKRVGPWPGQRVVDHARVL